MQRSLCFLLTCVIALAASVSAAGAETKASKELLHGSWTGKVEIDEAALKNDKRFKALSADEVNQFLTLLKAQFGKMKLDITFNADGSAAATLDMPNLPAAERKTKTAAWETVKSQGATITIKVTPDDKSGDKSKPREWTLRFADEKTVTLDASGLIPGVAIPEGAAFKLTKK